jgi:HSP20 family protein
MNKADIRKEWEEGRLIAPKVNIHETSDEFILKALMPGVKKEDVEVALAEGELTLYGKVTPVEVDESSAILQEIGNQNFYRVFTVNDPLDVDKIKARLEDGILTVLLPKHERAKPREIPVEVS